MARKKQKLPFVAGCLAFFLLLLSMACLAGTVTYYLITREMVSIDLPKELLSYMRSQDRASLVIGFVQSAVGVPTAIGLFLKKYWAYAVYTILNGFALGLGGVNLFLHHDWMAVVGILLNLGILVYMFRPGVRKVFS